MMILFDIICRLAFYGTSLLLLKLLSTSHRNWFATRLKKLYYHDYHYGPRGHSGVKCVIYSHFDKQNTQFDFFLNLLNVKVQGNT